MKPMLLIVIFLFSFKSYSQYHPMAIKDSHWIVFSLTDDGPCHYAYVVKGDTTIGATDYKKVYLRKIDSEASIFSDLLPPYYYSEEKLIGAIRDEPLEKKVFGKAFVANAWYFDSCDVYEDQLLYDFSVSIGEEISGCLHTQAGLFNAVVDSIKTAMLFGEERKLYHTGYGALIEGIGTWMGPFQPIYALPVPGNPTALKDYCNGSDDECEFIVTASNESFFNSVALLYPNPTSSKIKLELRTTIPVDSELRIKNLDGKTLEHLSHIPTTGSLDIDVTHFPNGLYILEIEAYEFTRTTRFVICR